MPRSLFYLYFPRSIWDSHWEKRSKRGIEASVGIVRTLSTSNIVQTWQVADMSLLGLSLGKTTRIVNCLRFVFLDVHTAAAVKHYWKAQRQCAAENTCMAHATLTVALNTEYSGKCKFLQILSGGCMNHQILQLQILRLCSNFTPAASSLNRNVCPLVLMAPPQLWICSNQLRMGFSPQISDGLQLGASTKNCSEKTHSISAWISPCDICQWKNKLTVEKLLVWNFSVGNLQFSSVLSLVENVFFSNPWR